MRPVDLIEYLDESELNSIKSLLDSKGIPYVVKQHGGASKHHSFYYKIAVDNNDLERASVLAKTIEINQKIDNTRCPKCKSGQYQKIENLNWLKRLWYSGTNPVRCNKCGEVFVI